MDKFKEFMRPGKRDRAIKKLKEVYEADKITIVPRTQLETSITMLNHEINDAFKEHKKYGIQDALAIYLNLRSHKHDVWVQFINTNKNFANQTVGDVRLSKFVSETLVRDHGIDIEMPPNAIANKTPDILFYNPNIGTVILGDVAIAVNPRAANERKHVKYDPIKKWLVGQGLNVEQSNFILSDDLKGLKSQVNNYEALGILSLRDDTITRYQSFHTACVTSMDRCFTVCREPQGLRRAIDDYDKVVTTANVYEIPQGDIILDNCQPDLEEPVIIEMIKKETERLVKEKFYDEGIGNTMESFQELIDLEKDKDHMSPKSTLMSVNNDLEHEDKTGHDLILDYVQDLTQNAEGVPCQYLLDLLPNGKQVLEMKDIYKSNRKTKCIEKKVFGPFQYSRKSSSTNRLTQELNKKLLLGKKVRNEKTKPSGIDPGTYEECYNFIEQSMAKLGKVSGKKPFLNDQWNTKTNMEAQSTVQERDNYNYCRSTVGAQMCNSMSNLYQRLTHLKTSLSIRDNVYVPPNASFIAVLPKEHAPVSSSNCDMPAIFITRYTAKEFNEACPSEYELIIRTNKYVYISSKLCRFNMNKAANWDQAGYKLVTVSSYLLSICPELVKSREKLIGIMTYFILDIHQKTSEYLDLLKYISYMPFSQVHRLSKLIKDKLNIIKKTRLDVWLLLTLKGFIQELANVNKLNVIKPKLQIFNGEMTRESLGLNITLPSFIDNHVRHKMPSQFIEEVNTLNIVRPKHLYGSQFMDKSIDSTVTWNVEYEEEVKKYGTWLTDGRPDPIYKQYPFEAKFAFSRDAIIHAHKAFLESDIYNSNKIQKNIGSKTYLSYMHYNCSLRGATKEPELRKNDCDLHTTSLEACLELYKTVNYAEEQCTVLNIANNFIESKAIMEFSMSEKDQRGQGRPIATPTLKTKATLMVIEKPESAIGVGVNSNIIVSGKNKLKEQSNQYKELVAVAALSGFKEIYQLTEDQSKFSENDNTRKYIPYVSGNILIDPNIRRLQVMALNKLIGREHLIKRLPKSLYEDSNKKRFINNSKNGVKAIIGWPQGMLNFISTSVHAIADHWITKAYNDAYPNDQVMTKGLVHSDDSWVSVACNSLDSFKRFSIFRMVAKKLFCLKLNDKKIWGSKYLGEIVSNYNINGNVHLSVTKVITNSFNNLMYQNWVIDVQSQISCLQQAYRNGADIATLILLATVLEQQILSCYQVKGKQKEIIYLLPVELGGYPNNDVLSLAVTGIQCHYNTLVTEYIINPTGSHSIIATKAMTLSAYNNKGIKLGKNFRFFKDTQEQNKYLTGDPSLDAEGNIIGYIENEEGDDDGEGFGGYKQIGKDDYNVAPMCGRGDVFTCVKHIMPRSKKMTQTIQAIKALRFTSEGIAMIVPRPKTIEEALGDLKESTDNMMYKLASEHYTQSVRRLAVSQAIQSSGKTVRIGDLKPMTINEVLTFIEATDVNKCDPEHLKTAFLDENNVAHVCNSAVYKSIFIPTDNDKRKIINRMPTTHDKYKTICKIEDVLLSIIDKKMNTNYYLKYGTKSYELDTRNSDVDKILKRFKSYFSLYQVKYACNLIMQQYINTRDSKHWMQPYIRDESIETFVCDLYGKTLSKDTNYKVTIGSSDYSGDTYDSKVVTTIYTSIVMNKLYDGKFKLVELDGASPRDIIHDLDPINLNENDTIKYAILYAYYHEIYDKIEDAIKNQIYTQYYVIPQKYTTKGKYTGRFKCYVKYNKTVLLFEGEPGDMRITSSTNKIRDITNGMMKFTERNFVRYRYEHPSMWPNFEMWATKSAVRSDIYLSSYAGGTTCITQSRSHYCVPLKLNPNLKYPGKIIYSRCKNYEFDETFRCVYQVDGTNSVRVLSVMQNLDSPLSDLCIFEPSRLEGFSNSMLFTTRIIMNLTLQKYYNNSARQFREAIQLRVVPTGNHRIADFIEVMANEISGREMDLSTIRDEIDEVDYEVITIGEVSAGKFITDNATVEAESLEYVETQYVYEETQRIAALTQHKSIYRLICKILLGFLPIKDIEDFLWIVFKDVDVVTYMTELVNSNEYEYSESIILLKESLNVIETECDELITFIVGNDLDRPSGMTKVDMIKILTSKFRLVKNNKIVDMSTLFVKILVEDLLGIVKEDKREVLASIMLKNRSKNV